jgi:hypothetical protein
MYNRGFAGAAENSVVVVASVSAALIAEFVKRGAVLLAPEDAASLGKHISEEEEEEEEEEASRCESARGYLSLLRRHSISEARNAYVPASFTAVAGGGVNSSIVGHTAYEIARLVPGLIERHPQVSRPPASPAPACFAARMQLPYSSFASPLIRSRRTLAAYSAEPRQSAPASQGRTRNSAHSWGTTRRQTSQPPSASRPRSSTTEASGIRRRCLPQKGTRSIARSLCSARRAS